MKQLIKEMWRFGVKGVGGLAANLALMTVFVEWAGIPPQFAVIISAVVLMLVGYQVVNRWVFGDHDGPDNLKAHLKRSLTFYAVQWGGKAVNYVIFIGLLDRVPYQAAWTIGAVSVFFVTFGANRWVWTRSAIAESG